jgi:hypothetical protein
MRIIYGVSSIHIIAANSRKWEIQIQIRHLFGYPAGKGVSGGI